MSTFRTWLFRGLVIAAGALLATSWFLPWWGSWSDQIAKNKDVVRIFPYGVWQNLGGWSGFLKGLTDMPAWFGPLMWLYLALVLAALAFAIWKIKINIRLFGRSFNLSRLIVGIVGFSYVVVVIIFWFYANMRAKQAGVHFIGRSFMEFSPVAKTYIHSGLRIGVYLACATGPLLIILAVLRNIITGKAKAVPPPETAV